MKEAEAKGRPPRTHLKLEGHVKHAAECARAVSEKVGLAGVPPEAEADFFFAP